VENEDTIFEVSYLKSFFEREPWELDKRVHHIKHILVTCDPNTRGDSEKKTGSDMSLMATVCISGTFIVSTDYHCKCINTYIISITIILYIHIYIYVYKSILLKEKKKM